MTEQNESALEADQDVVATETEEVEAPEAVDNTEGQDESQPADEKAEGDKPEAEPEDKSPAKLRRERRKKAEAERLAKQAETEAELQRAKERLKRFDDGKAPAPKQDEFDSYEEWQAALSAHHHMQAMDNRDRRSVSDEVSRYESEIAKVKAAEKAELAQSWAEQRAEATQKYPDFHAVFSDDVAVTTEMGELIASSDVGVDVAYYLGQNRQEAARIARMNPLEQARSIGAIEARMSMPKPKTTSSAPDPISPVGGSGGANATNPANMSPADYRKWRDAGGTF